MTLAELAGDGDNSLRHLPNLLKGVRNLITRAGLDDVRPALQKRAIALALKMHQVETEMAELFRDAQKPAAADSVRSRLKVGDGCVIVAAGGGPAPSEYGWNACKVCGLVVPIDERTRFVGGGDPIHEGCLRDWEARHG